MRGFQPKNKRNQEAEQPQPGLGMIRGKGTGTSDSIKAQVPAGSYIMPADSTEQIGSENLAGFGFKSRGVPVNVSNGEFGLSPEQVHAVGVQALEQMKNATHAPVAKPDENNPELFFANGGLVDPNDPKWGRGRVGPAFEPPTMRTVTPVPNPQNPALPPPQAQAAARTATQSTNAATASGGFGTGAISRMAAGAKGLGAFHLAASGLGGAVTGFDTPTSQYAERLGLDPNKNYGAAAELGIRTAGVMSDVGNAASFGILGRRFPDKQRIEAQNEGLAQQQRYAAWNATKTNNGGSDKTTSNPFDQPATTQPATQPVQAPTGTPQARDNNVTKVGNSYSGSNISNGFTVNGQAFDPAKGSLNPQANSQQNQQAVKNLMDNTPEFGGGFSTESYQQSLRNAAAQAGQINAAQQLQARQYDERQRIENDLRMAQGKAGFYSQGRGPTKAERDEIAGLRGQLAGVGAQGYDQYKNETNNNTALQKQLLGDQAATERTSIQEAGANSRNNANNQTERDKFLASNDLENRKFASDQQVRGFDIAKLQRQQKLYDQYDAAKTPEQKSAALKELQAATGQGDSWKGIALQGGTDANGVKTESVLAAVNERTGEMKRLNGGQQVAPPQNHIDALRKNPQQAAQFDAIYGEGAAERILSQ